MSNAFCQQCGTRRDDDSAPVCASCGAPFATGQSTPIIPSDEAPTRIGNRPPSSPQGGATPRPPASPPQGGQPGDQQSGQSGQQPWTPAAAQGAGNQGTGNQAPGHQTPPNQGPDQTAQFPQQPYGGAQPGAAAGQGGWQQTPPAYGQHGPGGPQGPHGPGGQQWGAPSQQPSKGGNAKLWILLGVAVLVIGGGIATALFFVLGGDDGDDKDSMSDEEQIEQVITDYNDGYQRLLEGDADACDDLIELVAGTEDGDLDSCRDEAEANATSDNTTTIKFISAEVDGDTAKATVEVSGSYSGSEPTTTETEMPMVKEDGDWKLNLEAETPSAEPSYGSEDPSSSYDYDEPTESPSY